MVDYALLLIDVQQAFSERDASDDNRSCPQAEQNIARLLGLFRKLDHTVIHIHHNSLEIDSAFSAGCTGGNVQEFAKPNSDETVMTKSVNSAFIGTKLEEQLNALGRPRLVICGATANHCVETTTRMAGNLGFDTFYVSDAVWAYDHMGMDGTVIPAAQIHAVSMANLNKEFAAVLDCDAVCNMISSKSAA
jgi:nicotinamidase-related amidase